LLATDGTATGTVEISTTAISSSESNLFATPNGIYMGGIDSSNGVELFQYTE
jgi:hypothetical protein